MDTPIIRGGHTQVLLLFGALYYENPYRGVSILKSCAYSCVCTHGKELESLYPNAHNERPK